ncbi:mutS protein homolog 4-like [Symsagittifera roscoffensis]|uniref:mutS protein homolog 4-like n=1 Tax=Symsagittifera roscoffensis TaxID=84072 RepID=UPI00307C0096
MTFLDSKQPVSAQWEFEAEKEASRQFVSSVTTPRPLTKKTVTESGHIEQLCSWRNVGSRSNLGSSRVKTVSTPGTSSVNRSEKTIEFSPTVIVAVTQGRGTAQGEVGVAAIDCEFPSVELFQFSDVPIYNSLVAILHSLHPLKIILPSTLFPHASSHSSTSSYNLVCLLNTHFPSVQVESFDRKFFNENQGLADIRRLCHAEFKAQVLVEVREKFYCLSALAAVVKYAEFVQRVLYHAQSLAFSFATNRHCLHIPHSSATDLELLRPLGQRKSLHSLFGFLNCCKTPGGQRLLRTNILVPPKDLNTIADRQQVIEELISNEDFLGRVRSRLTQYSELYRLLNLCSRTPTSSASGQ